MDSNNIENICDALCTRNGVLIKLKKNNGSFYKLNFHENLLAGNCDLNSKKTYEANEKYMFDY